MSKSLKLPERLDSGQFDSLKKQLSNIPEGDSVKDVDGSSVSYLGGLCLELLIASGVKIASASEELRDSLSLFGAQFLITED